MDLFQQERIDRLEELLFFIVHVKDEGRLGKSDPFGSSSRKLFHQLQIGIHGRSGKSVSLLVAVVAGQAQERVGTDEARHGLDAGGLGFVVFLEGLHVAGEGYFGGRR